jgi:hypothetical protein
VGGFWGMELSQKRVKLWSGLISGFRSARCAAFQKIIQLFFKHIKEGVTKAKT